jgi:hypothetical protein
MIEARELCAAVTTNCDSQRPHKRSQKPSAEMEHIRDSGERPRSRHEPYLRYTVVRHFRLMICHADDKGARS